MTQTVLWYMVVCVTCTENKRNLRNLNLFIALKIRLCTENSEAWTLLEVIDVL